MFGEDILLICDYFSVEANDNIVPAIEKIILGYATGISRLFVVSAEELPFTEAYQTAPCICSKLNEVILF